jgi:hypothetical protein
MALLYDRFATVDLPENSISKNSGPTVINFPMENCYGRWSTSHAICHILQPVHKQSLLAIHTESPSRTHRSGQLPKDKH